MSYQVILAICSDPLSHMLRWLGGLKYSVIGFNYDSSISSLYRLTLFNIYDVKIPSYLSNIKTIDELVNHPLVDRVYIYKFSLNDSDAIRFKLSITSLLTTDDKHDYIGSYVKECISRSISFRSVPSIAHVLRGTSNTLIQTFYHDMYNKSLDILTIPNKSSSSIRSSYDDTLSKQQYEIGHVHSMLRHIVDNMDDIPKRHDRHGLIQSIINLGDVLHQLIMVYNTNPISDIPLSLIIQRYNEIAKISNVQHIPEPNPKHQCSTVILDGHPVNHINVPFTGRLISSSVYDLSTLKREELVDILTYVDSLIDIDSSYIKLQTEITKLLAK